MFLANSFISHNEIMKILQSVICCFCNCGMAWQACSTRASQYQHDVVADMIRWRMPQYNCNCNLNLFFELKIFYFRRILQSILNNFRFFQKIFINALQRRAVAQGCHGFVWWVFFEELHRWTFMIPLTFLFAKIIIIFISLIDFFIYKKML